MMRKRGQGQSWSLDVVLAFVVFILIIGLFYALLNRGSNPTTPERLHLEATSVANSLDTSTGIGSKLSIIDKGSLSDDKIETLYNTSYTTIKTQFGIKGDFCIYVVDQYGNLVTVNTSKGQLVGFGNGNLTINGIGCGQPIAP